MSLKHAQLQDSVIGRSYVKIAQEKGWIQEETIKKEASAPDFQPTTNLMENILKLCRGLRQSGFDKYAEELESKFVQFKQANCHYDVSGETGEDLIHAAHPKGSHKLEGVESDESVIETVLDQHMKILEKILKMPHGKLSTAADIIDAVKVVLGQSYDNVKNKTESAYGGAFAAYNAAATAGRLSGPTIFWMKGQIIDINDITSKPSNEISLNDIADAISILNKIKNSIKPGLHGLKGITDLGVLKTVNDYLDGAIMDLNDAGEMIQKLVTRTTAPAPQLVPETTIAPVTVQSFSNPILKNVEERAQNLMDSLDSYKLIGKVAKMPQAIKHIDDQKAELSGFLTRLYQIKPERQNALAAQMQSELEKIEADVEQFESWVKGGK